MRTHALATLAAIVLVRGALAVPIRAQSRIAPAHLLAADGGDPQHSGHLRSSAP